MSYLLRIAFLFALSFSLSIANGKDVNPLAQYSKEWNNPKYLACNTAKNTQYLTKDEKEIIYILNMARMDPQLFCSTVVARANDIAGADTAGKYCRSLVKQMLTMKAVKLLQADQACYTSAQCHAVSTGKTGYVGHDRQTKECMNVQRYGGECCHYGSGNALKIVLKLLIDQDVESLGHREICFKAYGKVAPSIQPHKSYSQVTVIDFLY